MLKEVVNEIKQAGITLNQKKCKFCNSEFKYLGFVVNASGLLVDLEKVEDIFVYSRFVSNFSTVIASLIALTRKNAKIFAWGEK